ncbi:CAP domain-containing protein [Jannaschia seohaensis]|uniref:Hemolysin type calcium-binding protein n=1 Tax=Jannaschia seohaensis TaxID=475081 RepID=A0A2Y9B5E7_9RHOB|nr:CAP domain-containing protein [Jannaschia seohaensis]PWJ10193.1 hemolysin type calcium-binding protein [Jannaschia seohaensis]SSA51766.1 Hemolysin-type calcium-binding repeat-containing protein [Jannaschia seohaensis]
MTIATDLERRMLDLVNAARAAEGLGALALELNLNAAADDHSAWMLAENDFSHTGAGGSSPSERIAEAGFDLSGRWGTAENIAIQSVRGAPGLVDDVANLHTSLMNSPGHRANILNPSYDWIGIGIDTADFTYTGGWTFTSVVVTQKFAYTGGTVDPDPGPDASPSQPAEETPPADPAPGSPTQDTETEAPSDDPVAETPMQDPAPKAPTNDPASDPPEDETPATGPTEGDDLLHGTAEADTIDALGGDDSVEGDEGDDRLLGRGGADTLDGRAGADTLDGGWGADLLRGGDGNDRLSGSRGHDRLEGGTGADLLGGGRGNDTLEGGAGNDTLAGGDGDDVLTGGDGADVFVFVDSNGTPDGDRITDFESRQDSIWLSADLLGVDGGRLRLSYTELGTVARKADTRLLYDRETGEVRIDADGAGGAEAQLLVTFDGGDAPHSSDVLLI